MAELGGDGCLPNIFKLSGWRALSTAARCSASLVASLATQALALVSVSPEKAIICPDSFKHENRVFISKYFFRQEGPLRGRCSPSLRAQNLTF